MININSNISIKDNEIEIHNLDNEWVLVDKRQDKVAVMNETAFLIWECVKKNEKIQIKDLCCNLYSMFSEIDEEQIEFDILEIVDLMIQEELLYVL